MRIFARILLTLRGADAGDHRNWVQIRTWAKTLTLPVEASHVNDA